MSSQRQQSKAPITRLMNLLGACAACVIAIAIPLWYYVISISEMRDSLTIETVFIAKSIENIIQNRPDMWEFESVRLQEIVLQPTIEGKRQERVIRNAAGISVAKKRLCVRPPGYCDFIDSL